MAHTSAGRPPLENRCIDGNRHESVVGPVYAAWHKTDLDRFPPMKGPGYAIDNWDRYGTY